MKAFAFVLSILVVLSLSFAANYTMQYSASDWLTVTRTVTVADTSQCIPKGVSDVCANSGAIQPQNGAQSAQALFVITAQNTGPVDRRGVELTESLSQVPEGASIIFSPQPSSYDGRTATWAIDLSSGEAASVSYSLSIPVSEGAISRMPDITVRAPPAPITLSVPTNSKVGDRLTMRATSASGQPVANTVFYVLYPDGTRQAVKTASDGTASFTASREGFYTYSADGYSITNLASTEAAPAVTIPAVAAAATADKGLASSIVGVLPILAGIFAIAVVALIVYNFVAGRKEEQYEEKPSAPLTGAASSAQEPPLSYTQKFSFADEAKKDEKMRDISHDLLASRKKHLRETVEKEEEGEKAEIAEEGSEGTVIYEDEESELSALSEKAAKEGEAAEEEEEIEKTIAELEAIRERLRARKDAREAGEEEAPDEEPEEASEEEAPSEEEPEEVPEEEALGAEAISEEEPKFPSEEEEREEKPSQKRLVPKVKPTARKPVYEKRSAPASKAKPTKKGVKMRFGSKGVKKR